MNISAIGEGPNTAVVQAPTHSRATSVAPAQSPPAATAAISKPGDLMSKLVQLEQKDPAKFRELMTQLSKDTKTAAGSAKGEQAAALTKLADAFAQAASSGSVASLKPHMHAHAHHTASHASSGASAMQSVVQSALEQVNQALGLDPHAPESAQPMAQ